MSAACEAAAAVKSETHTSLINAEAASRECAAAFDTSLGELNDANRVAKKREMERIAMVGWSRW